MYSVCSHSTDLGDMNVIVLVISFPVEVGTSNSCRSWVSVLALQQDEVSFITFSVAEWRECQQLGTLPICKWLKTLFRLRWNFRPYEGRDC